MPGARDAIRKLTEKALKAGLDKVVLLSGKGETEAEACEQIVANSGLNYTLVRASWFNQNFSEGIFSEERIESFRDSLYTVWSEKNEPVFNASKDYGLQVADFIGEWMDKDNYKETRTMPKFSVDSDDPSRWQPTPPAYMNGIEPHWNKIRPFAIDSAAQFKPIPPPEFSLEEGSDFYKEVMEVYQVKKSMIGKGDKSEEIAIAQFWDCNPYVSVTRGHLMFATKKITPGAHWIGITKIASRKTNADFAKTLYAYTKTSIAIADAFISCWDEKYRRRLMLHLRPHYVHWCIQGTVGFAVRVPNCRRYTR